MMITDGRLWMRGARSTAWGAKRGTLRMSYLSLVQSIVDFDRVKSVVERISQEVAVRAFDEAEGPGFQLWKDPDEEEPLDPKKVARGASLHIRAARR